MPRKPRYLSHDINTQPPDTQTLSTPQSPWFPFIYGSENDETQNSFANIHSARSACTVGHTDVPLSPAVSSKG